MANPGMKRPVLERLMERVDVRGPDDCWEWQGPRQASGHAQISRGARGEGREGVHRIVYRERVGPIPDGMCVCHHCDNPPCVNPAHLFLGTQAANLRDMWAKGRGRATGARRPLRGERHGNAKLSDAQRDEIVRRAPHESMRALGREFGVCHEAIRKIVRGWPPSLPAR